MSPSETQITIFGSGIQGSEGIAQASDGALYTGSTDGWIYRIAPGGDVRSFARVGGRPLGIAIARDGALLVCNSALHALQRVDAAGRVSLVAERAGDRPFRTPNFAVFDDEGWLYLSDSGSANLQDPQPDGAVFLLSPSGECRLFADRLTFPNGLALRRGELALYAIQSAGDAILRLHIGPGRSFVGQSIFAAGLASIPDGMAFAENGDLLVTCVGTNRVYHIRPDGSIRILLEDSGGTHIAGPANIAFVGPRLRAIVVSNLKAPHLARFPVELAGQPLYHQQRIGRPR